MLHQTINIVNMTIQKLIRILKGNATQYQFGSDQTDPSSRRSIHLISLSDFMICFILKMSSAYYVCCIYLNDSKTTLNMEANNMNTMNLRSSLILVHSFSNKCNSSTSADEKTDDTLILGNGVKTRPYTLPSATDSACQNQQNDLSNQRILFLSEWKTLIPYN